MTDDEDMFFVGVKDPLEMRRHILETAKESIQTLQLLEKFRSIRGEKVKYVSQFKSDLREIARLLSKLKNSLPKAKLRLKLHKQEMLARGEGVKKGERKTAKKESKETSVVENPVKSELEKLEEELSAIEGKLGNLS